MNLLDLADRVRLADAVDAFNETTRIAMADGRPGRVELTVTDGSVPIAVAFAIDDAPVELAVDPSHRRHGHATALLDRLASSGERRFWAHGNLPAAQAVAASRGLTPARALLRLSRTGPPPSSVPVPPDVTIRSYRAADRRALLEVNTVAFAGHPEQGSLDRDRFERLTREEWFDPAGLFVAERAGRLIGFHWTKVVGGRGEIYVLGVLPDARAEGLGRLLTAQGLEHMAGRGVEQVDLYVEADNEPALALYRRLGFAELARDVLYTG